MIDKRDLAVLQFIAVVVILFAASWPGVVQFFSQYIPYAEVVIPAGAFVLLFQALFFVYTQYLWKLLSHTTYLGGQWIYKTINPSPPQCFYGVLEVIHTADKLLARNGETWYCGKPPTLDNKNALWHSDTILYQDEKLWLVANETELVANETESDKSQSTQIELFELYVKREEPQIKMNGTIRCIGDPAGEHASGPTEMIRIGIRPREDAAQEAYRFFGSS